jgi:hypothetical protein
MPQKVMDHRDLHRQPRSHQIVKLQPRPKKGQSRQLHSNANPTNEVELNPSQNGLLPVYLTADG